MKPHRICMTHHLVLAYGLHKKMDVFVSPSGLLRLACFKSPQYEGWV